MRSKNYVRLYRSVRNFKDHFVIRVNVRTDLIFTDVSNVFVISSGYSGRKYNTPLGCGVAVVPV